MRRWLLTPFLLLPFSCGEESPPTSTADALWIHGGTVITNDPDHPRATGVAVIDGKVVAVGDEETVRAVLPEGARSIDLDGAFLYPGFTDAHAHLLGIGFAALEVNLVGTASYAEVIERIRAFADAHPQQPWITGRGWDQNDWPVQEFPHHRALSEAVPDHPVFVRRIDGHAALANAVAMERAGVGASTPDPEGGKIHHDAEGAPTGVFIDAAMGLVGGKVPAANEEQRRAALELAIAACHRQGLTALHDAGISRQDFELYRQFAADHRLRLRIHGMVSGGDRRELEDWLASGPVLDADERGQLAVRAIKLYVDGALGSRGAALLQPYHDDPGNRGLVITPVERIEQITERALRNGFQVCTHAIGDRGNRLVLDAYQAALGAVPEAVDPRLRIEHAQVLAADDIPRFAALGVIPSMQAQHQTSDMPWAEDRLGSERVRGAYAWRSLLDQGVVIPGGSDAPVEVLDPLGAFIAATTRQNRAGEPADGWYPEQRMTRQEALEHLTSWPAYAAFRESDLGRVAPGFHADFTVLDQDLLRASEDQLRAAAVVMTLFAGEVVFRAAR